MPFIRPQICELFDFARVSLAPNASATVHLSLPASVLSHVDRYGDERLLAGKYKVRTHKLPQAANSVSKSLMLILK